MPYLQLHDAHYQLAEGETRVGPGADADLRLSAENPDGESDAAVLAVIAIAPDGSASLRLASGDGGVFVNGVPVGRESASLLHGDRVSIAGCELHFAEESQTGDTQEIPAASEIRIATPSAGVSEARSRGRVVSLTDGREYAVPREGIVFGREAGCDVVIAVANVSRRHATIASSASGYEVVDTSTNGVFVNGARVEGSLALARGDTLRMGTHEFRFYADADAPAPIRTLADAPSLQTTASIAALRRPAQALGHGTKSPAAGPSRVTESAAEPGPVASGRNAAAPSGLAGRDAALPSPPLRRSMPLATLEVLNEGPAKGMRHELYGPLSCVGRGAHNDVVIHDESVSESHAKIQRREDAWYLVDTDSTNGTYLAGERISGEARLTTGSDVRFGGVKMAFRALGGSQRTSGETRVIVGIRGPDPKRAEQRLKELARAAEEQDVPVRTGGAPAWMWVALVALVAFFVYLALQGRLWS